MACIVCGEPNTVKSHIIPRALFHDMKRPGRTIVTNRDDIGMKPLQSGHWDDTILCYEHEAQLGKADAYGIEFCRYFKERIEGTFEVEIPNPSPRLLVDFASACVWRMAASRSGHRPERMLGPYAKKIERSLFFVERFDPMLMISAHGYLDKNRDRLNIGVQPYRYFELGIRFWRFVVSGLIFDLKMDARRTPAEMAIFAVNESEAITVHEDLPQDAVVDPYLGDSLKRMHYRRPRKPRP